MSKARLEQKYLDDIRSALQKQLGVANVMETPKIVKIVLNVGVKEAVGDSKALKLVMDILTRVTGQKAVKTRARKSIAGFKLREGMAIGVRATLRKKSMYEFLDKLISVSLPRVRDFQGTSDKLDGQGNYNLGIKEWNIFPEVDYSVTEKLHGLNITIHTTAKNDAHGLALLKQFGMPFRKA